MQDGVLVGYQLWFWDTIGSESAWIHAAVHVKGQGVALCACVNFNLQLDKGFLVLFHIYEAVSLIMCVRVMMIWCDGVRHGD